MKYSWIKIHWEENGEFCTWEGKGLTMAEAKAKAALWGYRDPKWWQFWKEKPAIYCNL